MEESPKKQKVKGIVEEEKKVSVRAVEPERTNFKTLLLKNPNYFGNLATSPIPAAKAMQGNTTYEELGCIGYHPQQEYLQAVVYINQPSGYGTDICGQGTPEYVRFYLSYDNGATWKDQGMTSFQAYNIPQGTEGDKRIEYAAGLNVDPIRKFCKYENLIRVRAILSWNNPPLPNQPNWLPVWGNVREETILVEPYHYIFPKDIFDIIKVKFPPVLEDVLEPDIPIPILKKHLSISELSTLYKEKGIPVGRFAHKQLSSFALGKINLSAESFANLLPGIDVDFDIGDILFPTDGNISFEELKCIGLDPNTPNMLIGIIQVKKSSGYSGGPCTNGSKEYVTFWADFDNNGSFETCLGTADVTVYDVSNIPSSGLYYAVRLPVDLKDYRQPCNKGPKLVRIRAILSWNTPVLCANPNQVPVWGNREETLIHISPLTGAPAGKIAILGGIPVSFIDNVTGLTTPDAIFATNNLPPDNPDGNINTADGRPCPFGGRVTVQGAPLIGFSYKVEVIPEGGGAPTPVVTKLKVTDSNGNVSDHIANTVTGRFTYLPFNQNINAVLAQWDTTGDSKWTVRLTTFDPGGNFAGEDNHVIQLDNTAPEASIEITSGAGNCGKFGIGAVLSGNFVARDIYLSGYTISVEPAVNPPGVGVPNPASGVINTLPLPGNVWTLNTGPDPVNNLPGMTACGYIIRVVARDRAIVNSQSVGHYASDSEGFCLEVPKE